MNGKPPLRLVQPTGLKRTGPGVVEAPLDERGRESIQLETSWSHATMLDARSDSLLNSLVECAFVGALLTKPSLFNSAPQGLGPDHFGFDTLGRVYEAILAEIASGSDRALSLQVGKALGNTPEVRGLIAHLLSNVTSLLPNDVRAMGEAVLDLHRRRTLYDAAVSLREQLLIPGDYPTTALATQLMGQLDGLTVVDKVAPGPFSLDEALDAAEEAGQLALEHGGYTGVTVGMPSVDDVLQGLQGGDLFILGARPGMGKSALALQWAVNVGLDCRDGRLPGGVFVQSLEMKKVNMGRRLLAAYASVPSRLLKTGETALYTSMIRQARETLRGAPIEFDETAGLTVAQIALRARKAARKFGSLSLIVVDHLHIIRPDDVSERNGMTAALGKISRGLKQLAKDLDCPVLALAQLSRAVESRDDKRPTLSDLRASGDIEQDADAVAFLYRPEYYARKEGPEAKPGEGRAAHEARIRDHDDYLARIAGKAELVFEKVREGERKIVPLRFHDETTHFTEARQ